MHPRLAAVVVTLILTSCRAGPFITRITPLGDGKLMVESSKVGAFTPLLGMLPGTWNAGRFIEIVDTRAGKHRVLELVVRTRDKPPKHYFASTENITKEGHVWTIKTVSSFELTVDEGSDEWVVLLPPAELRKTP